MKSNVDNLADVWTPNRRTFAAGLAGWALGGMASCSSAQSPPSASPAVTGVDSGPTREEWLAQYFGTKAFGPPLAVSRFLDRTYYLIRELWWQATGESAPLGKIKVPQGFVTDFASIPRAFWSFLPPDDEYVTAAVVHDWLYWSQITTKAQADQALRDAMVELGVDGWKVALIYSGVYVGGASAWSGNAALRAAGERRVLNEWPTDLKIKWSDWKNRPGVFAGPL